MTLKAQNGHKPRVFGLAVAAMNGFGSILIIAITLVICADILGRGIFGTPIAGVAEMVSLAIVAVVFLQLGQAVRSNALARTDIVLSAIRRRSPSLANLIDGIYCAVAALLFAALFYGSWGKLLDTWSSNEHVGVYGLFVAPVWPVSGLVVLGSATASLQFLIHAIHHWCAALARHR